ncbi:MAG: hypothetical protein ACXW13_11875 [Burkholderiaceae bacterium]
MLPQLSKSARLKKATQAWFAGLEPQLVYDVERRLLNLSAMETPWK